MASSSARPTVERNVRLPACENGESDTFALRLECDVYRPPEAIQAREKQRCVSFAPRAREVRGQSMYAQRVRDSTRDERVRHV